MLSYIIRRIVQLIPLLVGISIISFVLIELPPGDFLTMRIITLEQSGTRVSEAQIASLKQQYGLDKPLYQRYFMWIWNIIRYGNFGRSFQWDKPVSEVIGERIVLTIVISICTLIFVWMMAIPIGIYSATRQYSPFDYVFTFLGFIGLAIPNFLLALVLMWLSFAYLGIPITGLFSSEYANAAWSLAKVWDMSQHIWIPVIVIGTAGTAGLIRIMRGCLLDELRKQYVITARAKGVSERNLLFKYPVRVAINPLISTIGWLLPAIISGEAITAIVLNLPTTGPVLLRALLCQDMYLAGSFVLILSVLTVIGTLISDILLAWVDPRIRYKGISE
jgi:peptide/nickel transport system permease protein